MSTPSLDLHALQDAFARLRDLAAAAEPDAPPGSGALWHAIETLGDELGRADAAARSLRQSEERARLLVDAVEDYAIFMLDPRGLVLSWNAGAQRIKGYAADEIIGQHFARFYLPDDVAAGKPMTVLSIAAQWGHYIEEGWRLRKDGSRFWASVVVTSIRDAGGALHGFGKVTRDLTERKVAEETLRQSEERFRLMVEGVRDYAIFMLDPGGYITSWNVGAQLIKGYSASEIVGSHFSVFYSAAEVAAGKPAWELEVAQREGRYEEEGWRLRKDGTRFWASLVLTPLYGAGGALRGFGKVTRDLSERKRADEEREQLRQRELDVQLEREQLRQMEEAVRLRDAFLAVASHELKTPLTTILGTAEHQQRRLARNQHVDPADQRRAQTLVAQARRLQRLIDGLLDINRLETDQFALSRRQFDLAELIREVVDEARPALERHELRVVLPGEPVPLDGDRERLEHVFHNLLQNAAKYAPGGGAITVELAAAPLLASVAVTDEGLGIASGDLPHIFERFYRAQGDERRLGGLGIGLYVAREIVSRHGGTIVAESEQGRGSRFTVSLPRPPAQEP